MKTLSIPYARQWIDEDDVEAVVRALRSEHLTTGPEIPAFEKELAERCGARFAVACSSGTAALHLAARAIGLGPGDEVVTSPITFLATASAPRMTGARVHFCDVDPRTANLDPVKLEALLKKRGRKIKAVFPVHFAGHPADMEAIRSLSERHGFRVVEDAAHALGAATTTAKGERALVGGCLHSDLAVFSFHPVKAITTGEGGAVTTNDAELHAKLLLLRNHGMVRKSEPDPWYYEMQDLGYNYRITDIQCALGRSQLAKLGRFLELRESLAAEYGRLLAERFGPEVKPLETRPGVRHARHLFPVRIPFAARGRTRAAVMRALKAEGIGTQVHYIPLHLQPYWRREGGFKPGDFPEAEKFYAEALSLPLYAALSPEETREVVEALERALGSPK